MLEPCVIPNFQILFGKGVDEYGYALNFIEGHQKKVASSSSMRYNTERCVRERHSQIAGFSSGHVVVQSHHVTCVVIRCGLQPPLFKHSEIVIVLILDGEYGGLIIPRHELDELSTRHFDHNRHCVSFFSFTCHQQRWYKFTSSPKTKEDIVAQLPNLPADMEAEYVNENAYRTFYVLSARSGHC